MQYNLNSEAIVPATPGAVPSVTALDEVPVVGGQEWYPRCASCSHLPPVHSRNPSGRAHGTSVPWVVSLMERVGSVIRSRALPLYMKPAPPVIAGNFVW